MILKLCIINRNLMIQFQSKDDLFVLGFKTNNLQTLITNFLIIFSLFLNFIKVVIFNIRTFSYNH